MVHIFEDLFWEISNFKEQQFAIKLSYIEIYNEVIRDLLSEMPTEKGQGLDIWEDASQGIFIVGVTEIIASSTKEVINLLHFGSQRWT